MHSGVVSALITEAMKKAAVAWVAPEDRPAVAVWPTWLEGSLLVLQGGGEQEVPGLAEATRATVTARGDHGGRIVTWPARVAVVLPESPDWEVALPHLLTARLNLPDHAAAAQRWAQEATLTRLTPLGEPVEAGPTLPGSSLAEPPRPSPARTPARLLRSRRQRSRADGV
jgi:hypothetical protein